MCLKLYKLRKTILLIFSSLIFLGRRRLWLLVTGSSFERQCRRQSKQSEGAPAESAGALIWTELLHIKTDLQGPHDKTS